MFRVIARYIVRLSLASRPSSAAQRRKPAGAEEPYAAEREVREDGVLGGADCCRESEVEVGEEDDHAGPPP